MTGWYQPHPPSSREGQVSNTIHCFLDVVEGSTGQYLHPMRLSHSAEELSKKKPRTKLHITHTRTRSESNLAEQSGSIHKGRVVLRGAGVVPSLDLLAVTPNLTGQGGPLQTKNNTNLPINVLPVRFGPIYC